MSDRLAEIRARADAATSGPWERGDVWQWAGVMASSFGEGRCAYCARSGDPVWIGQTDINGEQMLAHKHRNPTPYQPDHLISNPDGLVTGNYDYEAGGVLDPADAEFIAHARADIPHLLDLIDRVRAAIGEHRTSQGPAATVPVWAIQEALDGGEG